MSGYINEDKEGKVPKWVIPVGIVTAFICLILPILLMGGFALTMGWVAHELLTGEWYESDKVYYAQCEYEDTSELLKENAVYIREGFFEKLDFKKPTESEILYKWDAQDYVNNGLKEDFSGDMPESGDLIGYRFSQMQISKYIGAVHVAQVTMNVTCDKFLEEKEDIDFEKGKMRRDCIYLQSEEDSDDYYIKTADGYTLCINFEIALSYEELINGENGIEKEEKAKEYIVFTLIDNLMTYDEYIKSLPSGSIA